MGSTKRRQSSANEKGAPGKAANLGGCKSLYPRLPGNGRLAYPLLGKVTNRDRRGCKGHGCLMLKSISVGATWVASKFVGLRMIE